MPRLHATLLDYVVAAISPALIMSLVGSLVFFLVEIGHPGDYATRLQVILGLFVFAAVLIGRISIEQSREYATLFAIPLGVLTCIAAVRFVEFRGPLAPFGPWLSIGLVALVWWCADRLTWDCTVIDRTENPSGAGLLQTAGLESREPAAPPAEAAPPANLSETVRSWWQRYQAYRQRPHAPGVWVIYFSLAALPIFGLGGRFIPANDLASRRFAFQLLCVYVGSALGLLLTTSFLALRRYLRRRQLEMPVEMASVWLTIGAITIVAVLVVCALLPRPSPEYSVSHVDWFGAKSGQRTSPIAAGSDGPQRPSQSPNPTPTNSQRTSSGIIATPPPPNSTSPTQPPSTQPPSTQPPSTQPPPTQPPPTQPPPTQPPPTQPPPTQPPPTQPPPTQPPPTQPPPTQPPPTQPPPTQPATPPPQPMPGNQNATSPPGSPPTTPPTVNPPPTAAASPPSGSSSLLSASNLNSFFSGSLKLLYYGIVVAVVGFFLWKYRAIVSESLRQYWANLKALWDRLFGSRRERESAAAAPPPAPRLPTFADFANPFASGSAERSTPDSLVRYTFAAFEAWARDRGCPHNAEQTPFEFVQQVAAREAAVSAPVQQLAALYCQAAYSQAPLPPSCQDVLREVWRTLT